MENTGTHPSHSLPLLRNGGEGLFSEEASPSLSKRGGKGVSSHPSCLLFFLFISLFSFCSIEENNPVLGTRERTLLENKILGTWSWNTLYEHDTVTFRDDLTYESVSKGMTYDGTFTLGSDSLLKFSRRVVMHGGIFQEVMIYDLGWLEADNFMIAYHNAPMIYRRVR